ncbi:MAG TPA: GNAT family N-acetyltransferase [Terriglobia bacterium]|nr:GNAT family N-acetyltransferase [Terriglobia bacterium]
MVTIFHATNATAINHMRGLMRAFVAWHREHHHEDRALIERYFEPQKFEQELDGLPGPYVLRHRWSPAMRAQAEAEGQYCLRDVPPAAATSGLLIAYHGGQPAGCVALRDLGGSGAEGGTCEMKRMFVPVTFRGMGVGKALARRAIAEATQAGYARMRLDTSRRQAEAIRLYEKTGFTRIPPYGDVTEDLKSWLIFFERKLG